MGVNRDTRLESIGSHSIQRSQQKSGMRTRSYEWRRPVWVQFCPKWIPRVVGCGKTPSYSEFYGPGPWSSLAACVHYSVRKRKTVLEVIKRSRLLQRDGSEVGSTYCSQREPDFGSQHPHQPVHNHL